MFRIKNIRFEGIVEMNKLVCPMCDGNKVIKKELHTYILGLEDEDEVSISYECFDCGYEVAELGEFQ